MKILRLMCSLVMLSVGMLAQTTTIYHATGGTIHPWPAASATLFFGVSPYSDFLQVEFGSGVHFLNYYTLPDGTSASLNVVAGTITTLSGYLNYRFNGKATGLDSTGKPVIAYVTYKWHRKPSCGRGCGGGLIYIAGSGKLTRIK